MKKKLLIAEDDSLNVLDASALSCSPNRETNCIVEPDNVSYFFHFQRQFLTKLNETNYVNDQWGMPRQKEVILVKHHFPICQKIQQSHSNEHTIWRLGIIAAL